PGRTLKGPQPALTRSTRPWSSFTQIEPKPTASRTGVPPTCSVAASRPVCASMRPRLPESITATNREPSANARPTGWGSYTRLVRPPVRGSTPPTTSAQPPPADQRRPAPTTRNPHGPNGTVIRATTFRLVG